MFAGAWSGIFAASVPHLTILLRCQSRVFFEYLGKIALVFKTCGEGDIDDGIVSVGKEPFTLFDADHVQVFLEGGTDRLLKERGKVSRVQVDMGGHIIKGQCPGKIVGYVTDGFFDEFIAFAWNVIKHTFREDINGFLQFIAEIIQGADILQGHQKLIVDLKDTVAGSAALDRRPGQKGRKL